MSKTTSTKSSISPQERREIVKWIVQAALGLVGYGLLLFFSVGKLDWAWGWTLLAILAVFLAAHPLILIPINPALLVERERGLRDPRVKSWDRWVAALGGGVFPLASWIVAGLDVRFGWAGALPLATHLGGLLVTVLGYALFLWAMASNAFFAEGVRIQSERGHTVITDGPYSCVRHPGYAGATSSILATPFLLGSLWAVLPSLVAALLYVARTWLEDQTLMEELPGYKAYAQQTRSRLLPGIW
jgi:protein-S-isoprenylcysteine O-methyltransferase Ste14